VSATAIEIATARHPFIRFEVANLTDEGVVDRLLREHFNKGNERKLVVLAQVLSYLPAWRNLLERIGSVGADVLILLYLPENPIGYVKNERELVASVQQQFKILNRQQDSGGHIAILARSNSALRME
jgi:hypothetical protein